MRYLAWLAKLCHHSSFTQAMVTPSHFQPIETQLTTTHPKLSPAQVSIFTGMPKMVPPTVAVDENFFLDFHRRSAKFDVDISGALERA
jgi:hypothetical protein